MKGWPHSEAPPKMPTPRSADHLRELAHARMERLSSRIDRMQAQLDRAHAHPINLATAPVDGALIAESLARTAATLAGLRAEMAYWVSTWQLARSAALDAAMDRSGR